MNNPDLEVLFRAVQDARHILRECVISNSFDAAHMVERLHAVLDRDEVIHVLARVSRQPVAQLTEEG
ncbi:hypothetical protein GWG65_22375 [Bradyrhizobium sp. CSA207]|uniref:hypothetical protein n=1 Tax=Bradyrhizobium sp. CSA207 TaxID=2698826 RepID=UPI0023B08C76|nr:hypothetical protein [Bradyrhizobium sp. CSA207]MDE5444148.1 hypothetical protein [Bradyrhizobium sp. CSA207]